MKVARNQKNYFRAMISLAVIIASAVACAQESDKENTSIRNATKAIMNDYEIAAESDIHKFCAAEWPDDYSMQKHCINQQAEAREKAQKIDVMASPPPTTKIWANCTSEWTDKDSGLTDWVMMYHCFEKQTSAYRSLNP